VTVKSRRLSRPIGTHAEMMSLLSGAPAFFLFFFFLVADP
jgi:hypothetical protein